MSEPFTKVTVDEYAVPSQVWWCKCVRCGLVYSSPVKTEHGLCPNCERKSIKGEL